MRRFLVPITLVLVTAACSDGSDASSGANGGSCNWPGACGGDVVGTWKVSGECLLGTPANSSCPSWSASVAVQASGSFTFTADGSYSMNLDATVSEAATYPASCLSGVSDCASLATAFQQRSDVASASCSGTPSTSCSCHIGFVPLTGAGDGTYTTSGNMLTNTNSSGKTTTRSYCVKGNTMTWNAANDDGTEVILTAVRQ